MAVYYISHNGNNDNDGLTKSSALLSLEAAVNKTATLGDKICFLPGIHKMSYFTYTWKEGTATFTHNSLILDKGSSIEIFAEDPPETVLDGTDAISTSTVGFAISLKGKSIVRNLNIIFNPTGPTNYSNAIIGQRPNADSLIANCNFKIVGSNAAKSYIYDNNNNRNKVQNCNFNFEDPQPGDDYSGGTLWTNNIYPKLPTKGVSAYYVTRQADESDMSSIAPDCLNQGDPAILNTDGSRSHIGIFGGTYGNLWISDKYLVGFNNNAYSYDGAAWQDTGKTIDQLTESDFNDSVDIKYLNKAYLSQLGDSVDIIALGKNNMLTLGVTPYPQIVRPISSIDLSLAQNVKRITADDTEGVYRLFSVDDGVTWETFVDGVRQTVTLTGDNTADIAAIQQYGLTAATLGTVTSEMWDTVLPQESADKKIMLLMLISGDNKTRSLTVLQDRYGYYQAMLPTDYTIKQLINSISVKFSRAVPTEAKIMYIP